MRITGPRLGRKNPQIQKEERKIMIQDARVRNKVEGKIGEGKRKYGLGLILSFFRWLFWGEIGGIRSNFEGVPGQNPHIVSQLLPS
ncbi:MAG TPA: hypothetical protein DCE14_09325 [Kosmotogaceae bacterium]|nr:hypothetical protein [Kosmotogaceae bacterium]